MLTDSYRSRMGAAASSVTDLPERVDLATIDDTLRRFKLGHVQIDMVRFDLLKDKNNTISRGEALQLIENKLPPIYSLNAIAH